LPFFAVYRSIYAVYEPFLGCLCASLSFYVRVLSLYARVQVFYVRVLAFYARVQAFYARGPNLYVRVLAFYAQVPNLYARAQAFYARVQTFMCGFSPFMCGFQTFMREPKLFNERFFTRTTLVKKQPTEYDLVGHSTILLNDKPPNGLAVPLSK
jgi:hypothetical protein